MDPDLIHPDPPDDEIPHRLYEMGWRQGVVFPARGIEPWSARRQEGADSCLVMQPRPSTSTGQWVVVSQTSDIVAPLDKEPVVEALACVIEPDPTKRASYRRSYRRFVIDRTAGLVASAVDRVAFDKRTLLHLTPEPWPDSKFRLQLFSTWLARRASREAIPNPIVDAFIKPLGRVMDKLKPEIYRAFNESVREIRIHLPESQTPPFVINTVILLDQELSSEQDDAISHVLEKLRAKLKPQEAVLGEVRLLTADRMSVALLDATSLVDLEALSYEGDAVIGAGPSPR